MGVPKFYRFVSERYPLINTKIAPSVVPKIDNLYLDMNGIIHNCARGSAGNGGIDTKRYASNALTVKSEDDIFLDVFKYIDNLFAMVPPRKLLYMAIDGVAPRAKMNQQRARRFRSAKDRIDEHNRRADEDPMYAAAEIEPFDSNCITPGTEFMQKLTTALKYYVVKKISEDSRWANIDIVLSGAESPGEGEHKIMEYIRAVRETGHVPPNTRHCVYGLDADLIMLGLVTHEPHFFLLREKVDFSAFWKKKGGPRVATSLDTALFGDFELLSIGVLRQYLVLELGADGNSALPFFNVERIADDFVFILMLIGNDFLPNLPTLDIADGTLHVLLHLYKRLLPMLGGYLTKSGKIHPERLEFFLTKLGMLEKSALRHRNETEENARYGRGGRRGTRNTAVMNVDLDECFGIKRANGNLCPPALSLDELKRETLACRALVEDEELVRMKKQYYVRKFGMKSEVNLSAQLQPLAEAYVAGISWTLKYYTEGCRYWRWFYPYHYAPLASDITDVLTKLAVSERGFVQDKPFRPFDQLLSVLPPVSAWCLPKPFRSLMTNPASPIAEQYPEEFETDMNGKRNDWEAVVLLPFVDENSLLKAIETIPSSALTTRELQRNEHGPSMLYKSSAPKGNDVLHSPFGTRMPSVQCPSKCSDLVLPALPLGTSFRAELVEGTHAPHSCSSLADLPTLSLFPHEGRLDRVGINVFGSPSKSESVVLVMNFKSHESPSTVGEVQMNSTESIAEVEKRGVSVHSPVWFGYPWRRAGFVELVADASQTKRARLSTVESQHASWTGDVEVRLTDKNSFSTDTGIVLSKLLLKKGIEIASPYVIISVKVDTESGNGSKDEEVGDFLLPSHFVASRSVEKRVDMLPDPIRNITEGQAVLYVGHGPFHGHVGSVMSLRGSEVVRVQFNCPAVAAREPAFGYRVVSIAATQPWMTLSRLSSHLGMSVSVVDAFLGSVRVRLSSSKDEVDLGLGIKYISRGLCIPGYARRDERNYYVFSDKAGDLLVRYSSCFPNLFKAVEKSRYEDMRGGNGRGRGIPIFSAKDLFGNGKKADEAAKAACTWVSVQEVAGLPLVSADADVLSKETISELERHRTIACALQRDFKEHVHAEERVRIVKEVPRHLLMTGNGVQAASVKDALHGVGIVPFDGSGLRLGDRVVNRVSEGGVPFGLRGTVVGIHAHRPSKTTLGEVGEGDSQDSVLVEVVFDEGFITGGELQGRCSAGRGKAVPADTLVVIRPDRENQYYVKNYPRIAAQMTHPPKRRVTVEVDNSRRAAAIATAAIASYAEAVRSAPTRKQPSRRDANGEEREEPLLEVKESNLPLPSFAAGGRKWEGMANAKLCADSNKRKQLHPGSQMERDQQAEVLAELLRAELGISKAPRITSPAKTKRLSRGSRRDTMAIEGHVRGAKEVLALPQEEATETEFDSFWNCLQREAQR